MIRVPRGKIAVDPMLDPDISAGGIWIPDEAKDKCDQGIVRYVGPEVEDIEIGDHVLFSAYTGTTVRLEGEGLLIIMNAEFVTCRIDSPDTEIPGLYFMDRTGEYWTATREMATKLIAQAVTDQEVTGARQRTKPAPSEIKRGG